MDQASYHTSKKVKEYVEKQKRLYVFYLPPYSPNFNPDQKLWNPSQECRKMPPRTKYRRAKEACEANIKENIKICKNS